MFRRREAASIPSSSTSRWTRRTSCSSAAVRLSVFRTSFESVLVTPSIGFGSAQTAAEREQTDGEVLAQVTPEDILQFGLIPELVGRLPVITPLMPLTSEAMVRILTEPKNAIIKQYQHLFSLESAELDFTESALHAFADEAIRRKTGARALRAVMDEFMLDLMYDLPDRDNQNIVYVVDGHHVGNKPALDDLATVKASAKESA